MLKVDDMEVPAGPIKGHGCYAEKIGSQAQSCGATQPCKPCGFNRKNTTANPDRAMGIYLHVKACNVAAVQAAMNRARTQENR